MLTPLALPLVPVAAAVASPMPDVPTFGWYQHPTTAGNGAAEPSVGINWNTGAILFMDGIETWRVAVDLAANRADWLPAHSPYSRINFDPILFTDHVTGRTFAGGLDGACSILSYSDADGATGSWVPMGNACAGAAVDHETIGSGPWAGGKPAHALYDRVVYYCAQTSVAQCAVSADGGMTFGPGMPVPCGYANPGLHGSVHVGPDGTAYLPFKNCGSTGVNGVGVTTDNGLTWVGRPIPGATRPASSFDPDVATTTSGWAYVAYPTATWGVGVALTTDKGATWTNFGDVAAAAGIRASTFHEMVAGDDGRAAVAYLGSTTAGNPHAQGYAGIWHVYVTYTFDGGATWTTVKASNDIVQRGWICAAGINCGAGRNLLDFIDAQIDARGRVVVAYADGCLGSCELPTGGASQSTGARATVVHQLTGKTLFSAFDSPITAVSITSGTSALLGQPYTLAATVSAAMPYTATVVWGDGAVETFPGLASAAFTASHTYAAAGNHDVTISIVDAQSQTASATQRVSVTGGGGGSSIQIVSPDAGAAVEEIFTVSGVASLGGNAAPVAAYTFSASGRTVSFDARASSDADGDALAFAWTFGDGATGIGPTPVHTYAASGTYDACVSVSDGLAASELCRAVTLAAGAQTLATDPAGDAASPVPGRGNIDDQDILKLEADVSANGEPVFILTLGTLATPQARPEHGGVGSQWRVAWTGPMGVDFVDLNAALTTYSCQWGYRHAFDEGMGAAPCTVTPGTPGKITITYPASAMATRGYTGADVLAGVTATTGVYQGTPQDVEVWAGRTVTVDTLAAGDHQIASLALPLGSVGLPFAASPRAAPSSPPANPHITDRVADPVGDAVPTVNIQSGWFDSDEDFLYVGLKIQDIPADASSTAFLFYSVNFKPGYAVADEGWNGLVGTRTFTGLRAFALYSPVRGNLSLPPSVSSDTATKFELHVLSSTGATSSFGKLADVSGSVNPTTDIVWWAIPRTALQDPPGGGLLESTSAVSGTAVGGVVSWGGPGDTTGTGEPYTFPTTTVTAPTVTLGASPATGPAPLAVTFTTSVTPSSVASWTLDFGDGTSATGGSTLPATIPHLYEGAGTYVATLTVLTPQGATGSGEATVVAGSGSGTGDASVRLDVPGIAPVTAVCADGCATWSALLDLAELDSGSHTVTATLLQDGVPVAVDTRVVLLQRTISVVIDTPTDGADLLRGTLAVEGRLAGSSDRAPTAFLAADRAEGLAPLDVTFALDGTDDRGVASWTLTTGDGRSVTGATLPSSVAHTYEAAGTYTATLLVRDTRGHQATSSVAIRVQAENQPPSVPMSPSPATGATGVVETPVLSWSASDPDGNTLTYDVYMDTLDASTLVASGQTASYMPPTLAASTTYFWRVVASDGMLSTSSPVWSFTTRAGLTTEAQKPHVVVALIDSGANPYHQEFRRSLLVDHPATYLTSFPATAMQVDLCFYDPVTKTVDQARCPGSADAAAGNDATQWAKVKVTPTSQTGAGQGDLVWFPGTNVLLISFGHVGNAGFVGLDGSRGAGDEHGTQTMSNVAGATTGTCPECIVVMIEADTVEGVEAAYAWAASQPWIDVITSSVSIGVIGLGANPADFFDATSQSVKRAVQSGKIVFEAAGNGVANAGVAPMSTYLYANAAPWSIPVGCSAEHTGQACFYSDWPNPITASGASRMSALPDTFVGTDGVGGTSFSSPSAAGVAARALYALRAYYGDTQEGPSPTGTKSLVRIGNAAAPASGPLANGALTRLELEEVVFKTARRSAVPQLPWYIFPVEMVNTPVNFLKEGYGNVYRGDWGVGHTSAAATWSSSGDIVSVILGQKALPNRYLEEFWWERVVTPVQEEVFEDTDVPDTDSDAFPRNDPQNFDNVLGYSPRGDVDLRVPAAAAAVPAGQPLTPENKRVYLHHNNLGPSPTNPANSVYEFYMNSIANPSAGISPCNNVNCPDQTGIGGTGAGTAGASQTYTLSYPSLGGPTLLDTKKDVTVRIAATGWAAGPTVPLQMTATLTSGGALVGTRVLSGTPGALETIFEGTFKPQVGVLADPVELSISWAGPAYSMHVLSQGKSWLDLPVTTALPPVEPSLVTYYLDNFASWTSNGGTVTLTRDFSNLAGDADKGTFFPFPQADGIRINLVAEDALVTEPSVLGSAGSASVFLCFTPTAAPDAGAAVITARVALEVGGLPIGGGSITKQIVGPSDGRSVPVQVPLTLRPMLLPRDAPLTGTIVLSGPGGPATQNIGICGGSATRPWSVSLDAAPLGVAPAVTVEPLPGTVTGTVTVSGTASFPSIPQVSQKTWHATNFNSWSTANQQTFTLDTTAPGAGSAGPVFLPQPNGLSLGFRSVRPVAQDLPAIDGQGVAKAQFWVSAIGAAPRATVEMSVLLENAAGARRLVGTGSLTKDIAPPLGSTATVTHSPFVIDFVPAITEPAADERLVLLVSVRNAGPASTSQVSCVCGGADRPIYVQLPGRVETQPTDTLVEVELGGVLREVETSGGEWSTTLSTTSVANGLRTLTVTPRATYDGVARTGIAYTQQVTVQNAVTNTPPTATLGLSATSGRAPLALSATLGGSDAQTPGALLGWTMDWGDGAQTSGTGLPSTRAHTYAEPGLYLARLTVTDAGGMQSYSEQAVTVFEPAPVEKVVVILNGGAPVTATDLAGDGSYSRWRTSFDMQTRGLHTITARHVLGSDVLSETTVNVRVVAGLGILVDAPANGARIAPGGALEGSTQSEELPATGVVASLDPGFATSVDAMSDDGFATWTVELDALGLPEDVLTPVYVRASNGETNADARVDLLLDGAPNPDIVLPGSPLTQQAAQFLAAGTPAATGAPIASWAWSFGDGATSTQKDPTHAYARGGTYLVSLTVTDLDGRSATATRSLLVLNRAPSVELSYTPRDPTTASTVSFVATAADADGSVASVTLTAYDGTGPDAGVLATGGSTLSLRFPDDGNYRVRAVALDDEDAEGAYDLLLTILNLRPVARLTASAEVVGVGQEVVLDASGSHDPDGEVALYRFEPGDGTIVEQTTPVLRFAYAQRGVYHARVAVTDDDASTIHSATVRVVANAGPVLQPVPNQAVDEGETLSFTLVATDEENDPLTYSASPLPEGATLDSVTGAFSWTPTFQQTGNYDIEFSVSDGRLTSRERAIVSVGDVPLPPVLAPIGAKTGREADTLTFVVSATDADTPQLSFSAAGLPPGATFAPSTGVFSWTPTHTQAGLYAVTFSVTDGHFTDSEQVAILIENVDRAPTIKSVPPRSVQQTLALTVALSASDPDGDPITWNVAGPSGMTVRDDGAGKATLLFTPTAEQLGAYPVTVTAMAGEAAASTSTVVTVLFRADAALTPISRTGIVAYPDEVVTLVAVLKNTGPNTDTFLLSASNSEGWPMYGLPARATLAPGESRELRVNVTADRYAPLSFTVLTATSLGNTSMVKALQFRVHVGVVIELALEEPLPDGSRLPRGVVTTRFLDGALADGVEVAVVQTPRSFGSAYSTTHLGFTNQSGKYSFDFTRDPRALMPGTHELYVSAKLPGSADVLYVTSYRIGP